MTDDANERLESQTAETAAHFDVARRSAEIAARQIESASRMLAVMKEIREKMERDRNPPTAPG